MFALLASSLARKQMMQKEIWNFGGTLQLLLLNIQFCWISFFFYQVKRPIDNKCNMELAGMLQSWTTELSNPNPPKGF